MEIHYLFPEKVTSACCMTLPDKLSLFTFTNRKRIIHLYIFICEVILVEKLSSLSRFRILSGSALKLIAVISMLVDHSGLVFAQVLPFMTVPFLAIMGKNITVYYIARKIGRLAFPIYCFLIGEGFVHTGNRKKYICKLFLFAVLSEVPFDLMVSGALFDAAKQNVFFTLLFGVLLIYFLENTNDGLKKAVSMLAVIAAAAFLRSDYGVQGAVLILLMYIFRNQRAVQAVAAYPLLSGGTAAFASFIPINMYNGKRGFIRSEVQKLFFYLFYPLHMLLLVSAEQFIKAM